MHKYYNPKKGNHKGNIKIGIKKKEKIIGFVAGTTVRGFSPIPTFIMSRQAQTLQ